VLGAALAKAALGGATTWGIVLSAQGVGSIIGGLAMQRMHPRRPLVVATAATFPFAAPVGLLAIQAPAAAIIGASALTGVGVAVLSIPSVRGMRAPDERS
jgi:hypothetical protein